MIKTTTRVRCDKCGKSIFTHDGDHERIKANLHAAYGWIFPERFAYCKNCAKSWEDGEE